MSLGDWGLACLWLFGMLIVIAAVLGLVALADSTRGRAGGAGETPAVPGSSGLTAPSATGAPDPPA